MKISNKNINKLIIDSVAPVQLKNVKYLQPVYDSRQSFYRKAYTGEFLNCQYLVSYTTVVACIFQNQLRIYGAYSPTTAAPPGSMQTTISSSTRRSMPGSSRPISSSPMATR